MSLRRPQPRFTSTMSAIPEELPSPRSRRRHGVINIDDALTLSPNNKPLPPSPHSSLTFTHTGISFDFPLPPLSPASRPPRPQSPTPSLSSSYSQTSNSSALPMTPGASSDDDDFFLSPPTAPRYVPPTRRVTIKPLKIVKNRPMIEAETIWIDSDSESEREPESDTDEATEWYSREFSDILTISSSQLTTDSDAHPRPDSILVAAQLDPAFPRCDRPINKPVPAIPSLESPRVIDGSRPPPRMSLPADVFPPENDNDDGSDSTSQDDFAIVIADKDRLSLELAFSPLDLEMDGVSVVPVRDRKKRAVAVKSTITPMPSRNNMKANLSRSDSTSSRALRSRWSASTLSTLREEPRSSPAQVLNSATSRLKFLNFSPATKKSKEKMSVPVSPTSTWSISRPTSLSPPRARARARTHAHSGSVSSSASSSPSRSPTSPPLRRRTSSSARSDATVTMKRKGSKGGSSEESLASTPRMRRKPIPVEMRSTTTTTATFR